MTQYWLMKTEPTTYSIDDLIKETITPWEGVRNYQARNFMKNDMKVGDQVLFYHSNATPPGVVGLAQVCKLAYPDYFAWDKKSKYFDPKSPKENPRWWMVDVKFIEKFDHMITLNQIKENPQLNGIMVAQKGSRLSIQPLSKEHYDHIVKKAQSK